MLASQLPGVGLAEGVHDVPLHVIGGDVVGVALDRLAVDDQEFACTLVGDCCFVAVLHAKTWTESISR